MIARLLLPALALGATAAAASEPERVRVTGEMIDTWCYFSGVMGGYDAVVGSAHHTCALWCAAGGIPVGLKTDDGTVYMVLKLAGADPLAEPETLLTVAARRTDRRRAALRARRGELPRGRGRGRGRRRRPTSPTRTSGRCRASPSRSPTSEADHAPCAVIAAALAALPAAAQDFSAGSQASSWDLLGEQPARFEAEVVDVLCQLAGDCPARLRRRRAPTGAAARGRRRAGPADEERPAGVLRGGRRPRAILRPDRRGRRPPRRRARGDAGAVLHGPDHPPRGRGGADQGEPLHRRPGRRRTRRRPLRAASGSATTPRSTPASPRTAISASGPRPTRPSLRTGSDAGVWRSWRSPCSPAARQRMTAYVHSRRAAAGRRRRHRAPFPAGRSAGRSHLIDQTGAPRSEVDPAGRGRSWCSSATPSARASARMRCRPSRR